jgi:uncharacterized protein (TIGR03435 family)
MKSYALAVLVSSVLALSALVHAQARPDAAPTFEVASVRPNPSGGNRIEVTPGRLTVSSATLGACIKWAYDVQDVQISGANSQVSGLLNSERYDIEAKSTEPVPDGQMKLMLRSLLAERFEMTFHKETKEMGGFALVVDKNGPKFHPSQSDGPSRLQGSKSIRRWTATTMPELAAAVGEAMEAPVVDETGRSAKYDFSVDLTPYMPVGGERPDIPSIVVTAIREELGLKLEPRKAPVTVMVVDRLEKPSSN